MTNNEFTAEMTRRTGLTAAEVESLTTDLATELGERLAEGDTVSVQGFGTFGAKKKTERVVMNPSTRERMLVPPKVMVTFKASPALKERLRR